MLRRVYSVGEVTGYLRDLLEGDALLGNIWVRGRSPTASIIPPAIFTLP